MFQKLKVYREGLPFSKFLNKLCTSGASQVVLMVKNLAANAGDIRNTGSIPGLGRFPGEWHGNPLQYLLPRESSGQRSVMGYSPQGRKEWDTPETTQHACMRASLTLCDPMDFRVWNSPGQSTEVGSLSFLQGIFPTQGLKWGLLHCRRILYQLSFWESPKFITTL